MMVTMKVWHSEYNDRPSEVRTEVPYALAAAYGLNAGYYKVQAIDEDGILVQEWKQVL